MLPPLLQQHPWPLLRLSRLLLRLLRSPRQQRERVPTTCLSNLSATCYNVFREKRPSKSLLPKYVFVCQVKLTK